MARAPPKHAPFVYSLYGPEAELTRGSLDESQTIPTGGYTPSLVATSSLLDQNVGEFDYSIYDPNASDDLSTDPSHTPGGHARVRAESHVNLSWNERFSQALAAADGTEDSSHELALVSHDFNMVSEMYGKVIISEYFLDNELKTIKPLQNVGGIAGGTKYLVRGILFKMALAEADGHGLYVDSHGNPSDEFAAKAAAHELKGAMNYMSVQYESEFARHAAGAAAGDHRGEPGSHHNNAVASGDGAGDPESGGQRIVAVPLMSVIDFRGFRILAMTKLPIRPGVPPVYGSNDQGRTVYKSLPALNDLMERLANSLHLRGHQVVGGQTLHAAIDVEGHVGSDGRWYLLDLQRVFPPEHPHYSVLPPAHGGKSFLWRLLRPEFLRIWRDMGGPPLSPDALSMFSRGDPAANEINADVARATQALVHVVIPGFAQWLVRNQVYLSDVKLSECLHRNGINMRYLGLLRHHTGYTGSISTMLLIEMVCRTLKNQLRSHLRSHLRAVRDSSDAVFLSCVIDFLNQVVCTEDAHPSNTVPPGSHGQPQAGSFSPAALAAGAGRQSAASSFDAIQQASSQFWNIEVVVSLEERFGHMALDDHEKGRLRAIVKPHLGVIVPKLLDMLGIRISRLSATQFKRQPWGFHFVSADLRKINARVKHMSIADMCEGDMLCVQARDSTLDVETARLYHLATSKYRDAVTSFPGNPMSAKRLAKCLFLWGSLQMLTAHEALVHLEEAAALMLQTQGSSRFANLALAEIRQRYSRLSFSNLLPANVETMSAALRHHGVLTSLDLSGNRNMTNGGTDTSGTDSLASALAHNATLTSLQLEDTRLTDAALRPLLMALRTHSCLTDLGLANNRLLTISSASALFDYITVSDRHVLCSLDVRGNTFGNQLLAGLGVNGSGIGGDVADNPSSEQSGLDIIAQALMRNDSIVRFNGLSLKNLEPTVGECDQNHDMHAKLLGIHEFTFLCLHSMRHPHLKIASVRGMVCGPQFGRPLRQLSVTPGLIELDIRNCGLLDEGLSQLWPTLCQSKSLVCLDIRGNKLGDRGKLTLARSLQQHSSTCKLYSLSTDNWVIPMDNCSTLDLSTSEVTPSDARVIAFLLRSHPTITAAKLHNHCLDIGDLLGTTGRDTLNFSGQSLGCADGVLIGQLLRQNTCLTSLNLSSNYLGGVTFNIYEAQRTYDSSGYLSIAEALRSPRLTLLHLNLADNWMEAEAATALANSLLYNTCLTSLRLHHCELPCQDLRGASGLTCLDFSNQNLRAVDGVVIGNLLSINPSCTSLNLSNNKIAQAFQGYDEYHDSVYANNPHGVIALAQAVQTAHCALAVLDLSFNFQSEGTTFPREAVLELCSAIRSSITLCDLNLHGNNMSVHAVQHLADAALGSVLLERLELEGNILGERGNMALSQSLRLAGLEADVDGQSRSLGFRSWVGAAASVGVLSGVCWGSALLIKRCEPALESMKCSIQGISSKASYAGAGALSVAVCALLGWKLHQETIRKRSLLSPSGERRRVLVLGGSFAGHLCSRQLSSDFHVTVVEPKNYYEYTPGIPRALVEPSHLKVLHCALEWEGVDLLQGSVIHLDTNNALVQTSLGVQDLAFDYAVICTGSRYPAPIKPSGIEVTMERRRQCIEESNSELERARTVIIIGGGAVGVEVAAEIVYQFPSKQVTLVTRSSCLLRSLPARVNKHALDWLTSHGVNIRFNTVVRLQKDGSVMDSNGNSLQADMVYHCTGTRPNSEFAERHLAHHTDRRKSIVVDSSLHLVGVPHVFAAGDVKLHVSGEGNLAHTAELNARLVVENIRRSAGGHSLLQYPTGVSYHHTNPLVMLISLGRMDGILIFNNLVLCGKIAALGKWVNERMTMSQKQGRLLGKLYWGTVHRVTNIAHYFYPDGGYPTPAESARSRRKKTLNWF